MNRLLVALSGVLLFVASGTGSSAADEARVEFNRDIRPILSDNCFACHGPDEKARQAGLRFDIAEHAQTKLASGGTALVPGKVGESELARRIVAVDPSQRMPPADSGKRLTARQIELLKRWIEQGAEYQPHWSFVTPPRPAIPTAGATGAGLRSPVVVEGTGGSRRPPAAPGVPSAERRDYSTWPLNPIDNFVLDRLQRENLAPSPPAEMERLIRRVTFEQIAEDCRQLAKALARQSRQPEGLPYAKRAVEIFTALHSPDLQAAREALAECET